VEEGWMGEGQTLQFNQTICWKPILIHEMEDSMYIRGRTENGELEQQEEMKSRKIQVQCILPQLIWMRNG
jgi:hypothetical protein